MLDGGLSRSRSILRTAAVNVLVGGFLIFLANFLSVAAINLYRIYTGVGDAAIDARAFLPNYEGIAWAKDHFVEIAQIDVEYRAYYGWRRTPFRGTTTNVDADGVRRSTYSDGPTGAQTTIAFFGGSTMWGTGVDDANTIPSLVAEHSRGYRSVNFGETAFVAHQGLNRLLEQYVNGFRPDVVVFYDGVNDVIHKCRAELDSFSHVREVQIRQTLKKNLSDSADPESFLSLIAPLWHLAEKISGRLREKADPAQSQGFYDCPTNATKAERIAENLLVDWLVAKQLVTSYGGTFIGILQPVAFLSRTRMDHLHLDDAMAPQYETVYPIIRRKMAESSAKFGGLLFDFTELLDRDEYIYIDFAHLSPNGNKIVAERISQIVAGL